MQTTEKLTYISLFSNAGIGCYGFKQEKFECIATNELLENRLSIQECNDKCKYQSGYIYGDITLPATKTQVFKEVELWKNKEHIKEVDVIIATPPCQGMSVANHKKGNELHRNSLVVESIKLTNAIMPKFFIFENVRSFLKTYCKDLDGTLKPIRDAIEYNLTNYNILYSVVDFKRYGNPSQRTRTLIIGVRKDLSDITPLDLFPATERETTLRQAIGSFKPLKTMGEIDKDDIYHNCRPYPDYMVRWIKNLKEGASAFDNKDMRNKPHQVIKGKVVINKNKNGDKYRRCYWDKPGYCVHTRNDLLASQMTIHPRDNRVFSIRELMALMSIPSSFRWTNIDSEKLNSLTYEEKRKFLKREELNIRRTIGESVPTVIFQKIAHNIKNKLNRKILDNRKIEHLVCNKKLQKFKNIYNFLKQNLNDYNYHELSKIAELANSKRLHNAAYYTPQDICYSIIKDLPDFKGKKCVRILEPSVGVGNFIPLLLKKYEDNEKVIIDVVDVDKNSLRLLKLLMKKMNVPRNFSINYIVSDFLSTNICYRDKIFHFEKELKAADKYDIVIGNPPFKKMTNDYDLVNTYKRSCYNKDTNNIFSFFIEKALKIGNYVAFIVPKSLLSTPEYNKTRQLMSEFKIEKLCDYGEKAFNILIETISFIINVQKSKANLSENFVKVESWVTRDTKNLSQTYICDNEYPYWLIYRNSFFDNVSKKLVFDIFSVFRDRQITKKILKSTGRYRVLKSRNIGNLKIINRPKHDRYIDNIDALAIRKFINNENAILLPNLTYHPRACHLPKNCIADGSAAVALEKNGKKVRKSDLKYYSSKEFHSFYRIARNSSSRTMNIDSNSIFFFGKKTRKS